MVTSAFARPTSSRRTMSPRVVAVLAALAVLLLAGVGPASAHEPIEEPVVLAPPTTLPGPDTSIASQAAGSHASSAMPWPMLMMVIVGAAALLVPRRAPRLVVAALAVVLTVFGVESALHSVHHVFDNSAVACPTASIAAHLNGTTIEGPAVEVPVLPLGATLAAPDPGISPLSPFDPPHGRAPPSALV